jgi:hypothetical protein
LLARANEVRINARMASIRLPQGWTWEELAAQLEVQLDLEASSRATGAIRRRRAVTGAGQLLRLVLGYVLSGLSFRGTAAWAEAGGYGSLSDVALLKRMRRCAPWLRYLVSTLATLGCPEASVGAERRIVAVDATAICGPGDKQDYQLLHTVYDVTAQCFRATELTDRHTAERLDVGEIERGEIRLGDRAYGRWRDLRAVVEAGADYVVRLSANALKLRTPAGEAIKRSVLCKQAETQGIQDVTLSIHAGVGKEQMVARLIVLPLPEDKATAARRLMRKKACKSGYTASPEALATAGCLMLITSLPRDAFSAQSILALYRRRWQVELAFKRLKSLIGLEDIRLHDSELIGAWIHAILLVALLIDNERPSLHREAPDSPHWALHAVSRSHSGASSLCDASL